MRPFFSMCLLLTLMGCNQAGHLGNAPEFSVGQSRQEISAMYTKSPQTPAFNQTRASLWSGSKKSLLGDSRALQTGDILTVLIEIDDRAEISNSSARGRSASEELSIPQLWGIPQRSSSDLPEGASFENIIGISSDSNLSGDGSVKRKEKLKLRIAATIVDVLPNGVFSISGNQEVRVNNELRELIVSGFVRPEDISRKNQITYDKIASARISYGGRGQISDMQQPRIGYQILDTILPF